jgi:hypothetical protein
MFLVLFEKLRKSSEYRVTASRRKRPPPKSQEFGHDLRDLATIWRGVMSPVVAADACEAAIATNLVSTIVLDLDDILDILATVNE